MVTASVEEEGKGRRSRQEEKSTVTKIARVENEMRSYYAANAVLQSAMQNADTVIIFINLLVK